MAERVNPETFAHRMIRRMALEHDDFTVPDAYVRRVVDEMLELCPGVRESLVDDLMTDLKEEIARREDAKLSHATTELITQIENEWRNRA